MRGETVQIIVVDVGSELDLTGVGTLLGHTPEHAPLVARSPAPKYAAFPAPLEVRPDPDLVGAAPEGTRVEVRVHAVGALAVRLRVPFHVEGTPELAARADDARVGGMKLAEAALAIVELALPDLVDAHVTPYGVGVEGEAYTVHCITSVDGGPTRLVAEDRALLAGLAAGERSPERLSEDAIGSALRHTVRYYEDDVVVIGWDHAVIVSPPDTYEDVLDVMELANLELLELRTYDAYLDQRLDQAFDRLRRLWGRRGILRSAQDALSELSELRLEFAQLTDNLHDTGKLVGDWYLAKVHERLRVRFHLDDWDAAIDHKIDSLDAMFQLAGQTTDQRRTLVLEAMIVLLFILDLVALVLLAK